MGEEQSQAAEHRALRHVAFRDELETRLGGAGVLEDDGGALVQGHLARSTRLGSAERGSLYRKAAYMQRRGKLSAPKKGALDVAEVLPAAAHDYDPIRMAALPEARAAGRVGVVRDGRGVGEDARGVMGGMQGGAACGGAMGRALRRGRWAGKRRFLAALLGACIMVAEWRPGIRRRHIRHPET